MVVAACSKLGSRWIPSVSSRNGRRHFQSLLESYDSQCGGAVIPERAHCRPGKVGRTRHPVSQGVSPSTSSCPRKRASTIAEGWASNRIAKASVFAPPSQPAWMPAFAGMTARVRNILAKGRPGTTTFPDSSGRTLAPQTPRHSLALSGYSEQSPVATPKASQVSGQCSGWQAFRTSPPR